MKNALKVSVITLATLLGGVALSAPKAEAQMSNQRGWLTQRSDRDYRNYDRDHRNRNFRNIRNYQNYFSRFLSNRRHDNLYQRHYRFNRPITRFHLNRNYYNYPRLYNRYSFFNRYDFARNYFIPREVVIIDRYDTDRSITIVNQNTGPFSVNRAVVRVNSDFFSRIVNDFDITENVDIRVNTGDNTISFNTVTGDISTGDVDIVVE